MKGDIVMTDKEIFLKTAYAYNLDKGIFELRFLRGLNDKGGIHYGYFNDLDKAYEVIQLLWHKYTCYFTLQEVNPNVIARCENCLKPTKTVTSDNDILNYRFLHIDVDPCRPSGIQSTKEESECAFERAKSVHKFLKENLDFPSPILVFSGNGTTLDYRTERLLVNTENKNLMKDCLQVLSLLFSDNQASIDTTVFNPSRIIKLAGTISAKGSGTDERPHRMSKVLKVPSDMKEVEKSKLIILADMLKELKSE